MNPLFNLYHYMNPLCPLWGCLTHNQHLKPLKYDLIPFIAMEFSSNYLLNDD